MDERQARGDKTKRDLIQSARTVFAIYGYTAASVRTIGAMAKANSALIRYHFGSKQGLYDAVISRILATEPAELEEEDERILRWADLENALEGDRARLALPRIEHALHSALERVRTELDADSEEQARAAS